MTLQLVEPATEQRRVIKPQAGPQSDFLASSADIVVYGGAAGSGKSYALLLEPLRHITTVPGFGGVIFRRTSPQIRNEGGLWDTSEKLYPAVGADPRESILEWSFETPTGMFPNSLRFGHMQYEHNKYDYDGSQIPFIGFDELIHFTESQFWYMLTRNRSTCGVRPYVRATTNPDPDSWVLELIAWWIDMDELSPNYGYARPERSGVVRWFVRINDEMHWADTREELEQAFPDLPEDAVRPKSITFVAAKLSDNQELLRTNPDYLANLLAQPRVERLRLLGDGDRGGNWAVRGVAGDYFQRSWFKVVSAAPRDDILARIRYWDLAASEGKNDWTVGTLMSKTRAGLYTVEDETRVQLSPGGVERTIVNTAAQDEQEYGPVTIWIERDPGQAGVMETQYYTRLLDGYDVRITPVPRSSKLERAKLFSAQCEAGNVHIVAGAWNAGWLRELEAFPEGDHDDRVDSSSGGWKRLQMTRPKRRAARTHTSSIFDMPQIDGRNDRPRNRRRAL